MTQNIIYILIYSIIIFYSYKKKKLGTSILFLYTGVNFLLTFLVIDDEITRELLSNSIACNIVIVLGYLSIKNNNTIFNKENLIISTKIINKVFLIFSLFIFYHYLMIGIPYLSENIDTLRFNLRSSGIFGLPSRLAIYGIIILFIITLLSFEYNLVNKKQLIGYFLIIFLFMTFQSSKSSILPIIFYLIVCYPVINDKKKYIYTYKNFLFLFIIAFIYFLFIFDQLRSISNIGIYDYLVLRRTVIAYDSAIFLIYQMNHNDFIFVFNNGALNDLFYPMFTLFDANVSTLNEQLSRKLYGNYNILSVPVTPGWFAYHYFLFSESKLLIYAYSFCFGILIGFVENKTLTSNSLVIKTAFLTISYWMWIGYAKGNLYYIILNLLLTLSILFLINIFIKKDKI